MLHHSPRLFRYRVPNVLIKRPLGIDAMSVVAGACVGGSLVLVPMMMKLKESDVVGVKATAAFKEAELRLTDEMAKTVALNYTLDTIRKESEETIASRDGVIERLQKDVKAAEIVAAQERTKVTQTEAIVKRLRSEKEVLTSEKLRMRHSIHHRQQFGEVQLEQLLEESGLPFSLQQTLEGGGRPDAVVSLPGKRSLVVDAKTPFGDMFAENPDDLGWTLEQEEKGRLEFIAKVKRHISELARRNYAAKLPGALPQVCLYLRVWDGPWVVAASHAEGALLSFAASRNVALVGPSLLACLLGPFAQDLRAEQLNERAAANGTANGLSAEQLIQLVDTDVLQKGAKDVESAAKRTAKLVGQHVKVVAEVKKQLLELTSTDKNVVEAPGATRTDDEGAAVETETVNGAVIEAATTTIAATPARQ